MSFPFVVQKPDPFEVFTLKQAREWVNMDIEGVTYADDKIKDLVIEAMALVETKTNISLGISKYQWYPDCFPTEIPDTFYVREITSISHTKDEVDTVIDPVNYRLIPLGRRRKKIHWVSGFERGRYPFKVEFTAGYAPEEIPKELVMAIRVLVGALYNSEGDPIAEKKTFSEKLINLHMIGYA